ncbi:hypothetical protein C0993_011790 [Termitomyces sp. T159_Od127]|nr:hypothetical protein C0993_011790 [Termitomyces sp. T159_Od127]
MPHSMIWNKAIRNEYPGVRVFAQRLKSAIMAAHNCILAARIKQTRNANRKQANVPFKEVSEAEPEHEDKWAADKILNHLGPPGEPIFEVLWHAGDKTWLPYDQVREMDLIAPYLEAQGIENISDLPAGAGQLPADNPQLTSVDPNIVLHPAQLLKFLKYDNNIWHCSATIDTIEPCGYDAFVHAYNALKGDNPCEFIIHDATTGLFNYDSFSIPVSIITFPIIDLRYAELHAFGVINAKGDLDAKAWASMKNMLLHPHRKAVCNQRQSETHCKEKESKQQCYDDAHPNGFDYP